MATPVEVYLQENDGDVVKYHKGITEGWRIGQAFFNALSHQDQGRVVGTPHDPFYSIDPAKVEATIQWLSSNPPKEKKS